MLTTDVNHNAAFSVPDPSITDAGHAGRTLRALALPSISVIIRAIIAAIPASFWTSLVQMVIRLLPFMTTKAMAGSATVVSQADIEAAISKTK